MRSANNMRQLNSKHLFHLLAVLLLLSWQSAMAADFPFPDPYDITIKEGRYTVHQVATEITKQTEVAFSYGNKLANTSIKVNDANRFVRQNINQCWRRNTNYEVAFHANISVPTGGTVEEISLALAIDGEIDPSSIMTFTPAAVEEAGNVGADIIVTVPFICSCSGVSVRNISTQAITVSNANIVFDA